MPARPRHDPDALSPAPTPPAPSEPLATTVVSTDDGVAIPVHDLGGEGPPLLLTHATGFHGLVWRPLAEHLEARRCWAPDLRGHGDAGVPPDRHFDWQGFADDVLAVVDRFGWRDLAAVGHSKGGAALLLAEQRRPGTFRTLYLYEPVVIPPRQTISEGIENPLAEGALRRRRSFPSYAAAIENFSTKPPLDALDPAALRAYVQHGFSLREDGTVELKCAPEDEAQIYRMGAAHDAFDHLDRVRCPVVVARGSMTGFGPGVHAPAIVAGLPRGRLLDFPSLGHFGPLEDPAGVASSVASFLAEHS